MNTILIVIPILVILMFQLGLTLRLRDFKLIAARPKAVFVGLLGQIVLLPLIAFWVAKACSVEALYFVGIMLIACSPGGSSSNAFSMLAKGDVALSVLLTTLSSIITLFSIPLILSFTTSYLSMGANELIELPVGKMFMQNIVLMLLPIVLGVLFKRFAPRAAQKTDFVLSKVAFPALLLLAGVFFAQHYSTIVAEMSGLGACVSVFMLCAMLCSVGISYLFGLNKKEKRTIIIEVGMQNAATAIALASSPLVFNNDVMAIPAIIYALIMNVVLLSYLKIVMRKSKTNE